jgi:APA family basic amino acid/polyamine antiporter
MERPPAGLQRGMGAFTATCVVLGSIVGSAVFLVPAEIARELPSPTLTLAVWGVAGAISFMGGLTFAELGAAFPGSGGPYLYLRAAFGPFSGYLYGWTMVLIALPAAIAAEAAGLAQLVPGLGGTPTLARVWASLVLLTLTGVNLIHVRAGRGVLNATTAIKIGALALVALAGTLLPARYPALGQAQNGAASPTVAAFGVALIAAFWTFDGWSYLSFVAAEVRAPRRNLPLGMATGIAIVLLLYVGIQIGIRRFLPVEGIAASPFPGRDAAIAMAGPRAALLLVLVCLWGTLNCANATILGGGRVGYAMARAGDLPAFLGYVHPRFRVPSAALVLQLGLALAYLWSGTYTELFTYVMFASFVFYGLSALALLHLRRTHKTLPRPFRVPFYPWLPLAYLASTVLFLGNAAWSKPRESLVGMGLVMAGIPFYWAWRRVRRTTSAQATTSDEDLALG